MTNNTALFDAALATIADSNGAWITSPAQAPYVGQANAAVAVATEIDAAIPVVVTGATISQRNLLVAITKSVMEGRSPTNTTPATYAAIAAAIAGMFAEYKTRLLNNDVGGGAGTLLNLSTVLFVDNGTTAPAPSQNGNIESPFATITAGIAAANDGDTLFLTQRSYFAEGVITVTKNLNIIGFGVAVSTVSLDDMTIAANKTAFVKDVSITGALVLPATSFFYGNRGAITGGISGGGGVNIKDMTVTTSISCSNLIAERCTLVGNITLSDTTCRLTLCENAGTPTVTFSGAAGTVTMDGYTYHKWLLSGGTIVNGTIAVINSLPSATVSAALPVLANGQVEYVNVSMVGSALEGITEGTPIGYNPVDDLAPGDTGGAVFVPAARVSADNTVRLTVVGPLDAPQSSDFIITKLAAL